MCLLCWKSQQWEQPLLEGYLISINLPVSHLSPLPVCHPGQVSNRELRRKDDEMRNIRVHALIHAGAIIAVDIFFHFFYILTLPSDLKFMNRLSDWSLGEWLCLDTFTHVLSFRAVVILISSRPY